MKRYYFRVDGGNIYAIATGHITRCLKLAEYIQAREESEVNFIMKDYPEGVKLAKDKFKVLLLPRDSDKENEINFISKAIDKNAYFICDLRNIDDNYISRIRNNCLAFILFDDLGQKDIRPDILINPTPFCYDGYASSGYPDTALLLGEKYFFINQGLINKARVRDFQKDKYSILVSFGGADPLNITEFFLQAIAPKLGRHDISVILGPAYAKKERILKEYSGIKNIKFYQDIFPLDDMFLAHDIAFVCGGDTCLEACASGIATFIISSISYEKKIAELLHKKQMAYFITDVEDIKNKGFSADNIEDLCKEKNRLITLSRRGMNLIDALGLERVYNFLREKNNAGKYERNRIYTH